MYVCNKMAKFKRFSIIRKKSLSIVQKKKLSVSYLIRKLKILLNIKYNEKLCICMFILYDGVNIDEICPKHKSNKNNKIVDSLLGNFISKNIIYCSILNPDQIINDIKIYMTLPLIIHMHVLPDGSECFFYNQTSPVKLNNSNIGFINFLIINFISCSCKNCTNYNYLIDKNKEITFKYALFINYNYKTKKLENYINKTTSSSSNLLFKLNIGKFINVH